LTRDQTKSRLSAASQWLDGPGSELPGAAAAKRAITSFLAPFTAGALNTPADEDELVETIVSEGRFHLAPSATLKRQTKELEEAVNAAIVAARKEPWPTVTMSDAASVTSSDTAHRLR
jgi:hypothetical protein